MTEIRWGIIGGGDVCERKGGPPLYGVPGSRLIGVTRRDRAKGEDYARRHGPCHYYDSYEALLEDREINAIYIATPPELHVENTVAAAAAGKHVLCEKPMAMDARKCRRMVGACRDAGVVLAVAFYRRCYPSVLRAKELIERGSPGPLQTIHINDQFPPSHRLDLIHFFAGDIATICLDERPLVAGSHAEHGAYFTAISRSGVTAEMNVGWHETGEPETIECICSDGEIIIDDLKGGSLVVHTGGRATRETFPPLPATHWGIVQNFVGHFRDGRPLACDGEEGRKSSVILDFVSATPHDGREVEIDYEYPPEMERLKAECLRLLE